MTVTSGRVGTGGVTDAVGRKWHRYVELCEAEIVLRRAGF